MNRSIIKIHNGDFAIVKSKKSYKNAFANINDGKEISVIFEQDKINYKDIIEIERDWKLIIFDMVLDFGLTGFIFKISSAL